MTNFGFTLSSEEHGPRELVRLAERAEDSGFEFCSISDHFHPWIQRQGHRVDHRGRHYEVENARLFDPPADSPQIIVSAFGPEALALAARIGDGLWGHTPDPDVSAEFERCGGSGPRYAQIAVCVGPDAGSCRSTVHEVWPNAGLPGQMSQDLPTWTHFEQAALLVSVEQATEHIPCGNDIEPIVALARSYETAGFDHLYFHQIGPDQDAFFELWTEELGDAVAAM